MNHAWSFCGASRNPSRPCLGRSLSSPVNAMPKFWRLDWPANAICDVASKEVFCVEIFERLTSEQFFLHSFVTFFLFSMVYPQNFVKMETEAAVCILFLCFVVVFIWPEVVVDSNSASSFSKQVYLVVWRHICVKFNAKCSFNYNVDTYALFYGNFCCFSNINIHNVDHFYKPLTWGSI